MNSARRSASTRSRRGPCCGPSSGLDAAAASARSSRKTALKRGGSPEDIARAALLLRRRRALRHGPGPGRRRRSQPLTQRSPSGALGPARRSQAKSDRPHRVRDRAAASSRHSSPQRPAAASDARRSGAISAAGPSMYGRLSRSGRGSFSPGSSHDRVAEQQDVEIHRARRPFRRMALAAAGRFRLVQALDHVVHG